MYFKSGFEKLQMGQVYTNRHQKKEKIPSKSLPNVEVETSDKEI